MYKYFQILACVLFCLNLAIFALSDETTENPHEVEIIGEHIVDDQDTVNIVFGFEQQAVTDLSEKRKRIAEMDHDTLPGMLLAEGVITPFPVDTP